MINELQNNNLQLNINSQKLATATKGAKPKITGSNPAKLSEKYKPVIKEIESVVPESVNPMATKERQPPPIYGASVIQSVGGLNIMA
jgi:hypothetical protein